MVTSLINLSSGFQEQPDTLGLSTDTGLVQGCDGVHSHNVDRSSTLDEVLQQGGVPLRGRFVHLCPFCPTACRKQLTADQSVHTPHAQPVLQHTCQSVILFYIY